MICQKSFTMHYNEPYILKEKKWNNALSYLTREQFLGTKPELIIPSCISGNIEDVRLWEGIVFEEVENGILKSCKWLKHFLRLRENEIPTTIFDNHNHALYFWIKAIHEWRIKPWFELIHIDEHSDLWENENFFDRDKSLKSLEYAWEFTNFSCNVGNYIVPAIKAWIVGKMIRIENEFQLDQYKNYSPGANTVLNIDLDFFAPEMDFIPEEKKFKLIRKLLPKVQCVTIATSPYFIDQWLAIEKLKQILLI